MNNTVEYVDINKICRLCLRKTDIVPLTALITTKHVLSNQNISFVEMLEAHVNFKICQGDSKPDNICQPCITQLFQAYHFFEMCVLSNNILDEALRHSNTKEIETIDLVEDNSDSELTAENGIVLDVKDNNSLINEIDVKDLNGESVALEEVKVCKTEFDFINCTFSTCDEEVIKTEDDELPTSPNQYVNEQENTTSTTSDEHNYSIIMNYENGSVNIKRRLNIRGNNPEEKPKTSRKRRVIKRTVLKKAPFNCLICKEPFSTFGSVINHFDKTHEGTSRCILCDTYFKNRSTKVLKYHMNTHRRKTARFDCRKCREYFLTKEEMAEHYDSVEHNADPLACKMCSRVFMKKRSLLQHILSHTEERKNQCSMCGQCFKYTGGLHKHIRITHKGIRLLCSICGKVFTTKMGMDTHIQAVHEGNKSVYRVNRMRWLRKKHPEKNRTKDQSTKCKYCDEEFGSVRGRERHEVLRHDAVHEYMCYRCLKVFPSGKERSAHMDSVHYKYKCPDCNRGFTTECVFKNHVESHKKPGYTKCIHCNLECRTTTALKIHMHVHTGDRPYKCDNCDKRFRQPTHLRSHQFQHARKKPYECNLCKKAYPSPSLLNAHLNVHAGERPFTCDLCNKAYTEKGTLTKHNKRVHGGLGIAVTKSENNIFDVHTGIMRAESI